LKVEVGLMMVVVRMGLEDLVVDGVRSTGGLTQSKVQEPRLFECSCDKEIVELWGCWGRKAVAVAVRKMTMVLEKL
jgi:hypothetical protein